MIDKGHLLSLTRQARLLDLSRSSLYYQPAGTSDEDLALMAAIDEIHLELPFYGARRIKDELHARAFVVGRGHTSTLMRRMGMTALYPKRKLSNPAPGHKVYPYLLRGMDIKAAGEVWCADVTYLPMARGFCYLTAVMDWASRRVLSFRLSNTLDASFCIEALEEALDRYEAPEIFNTDQGLPVHLGGIHGPAQLPWHRHQHGRPGPLAGQRLHRAAVEGREIRGGVPQGIREHSRGSSRTRDLLRLLQHAAQTSRPRRPDPR